MKVKVYYKTGEKVELSQIKKVETTDEEIIINIEKRINRYCINEAEIIEMFAYGEEIHTIKGK